MSWMNHKSYSSKGNLLKGIVNKTVRRFRRLRTLFTYVLFSVTYFLWGYKMVQNWVPWKLQVFPKTIFWMEIIYGQHTLLFYQIEPWKMGPLQFCLLVLLGIHRNPKQKYFFNSLEGFLRYVIPFIHFHPLG